MNTNKEHTPGHGVTRSLRLLDEDALFDSSGTLACVLTEDYAAQCAIDRSARRVERKPRLDELDESEI